MSIYFDFDIGPTGRRFRVAVDEDKPYIELIRKQKQTKELFHFNSIGSLIELSTLPIVMINSQHRVKGFMALSDRPPLPGVDPAHWEIWIRNMYKKIFLSRNTLFIHFICFEDSVAKFFIEEALSAVFLSDFYLKHICVLVPHKYVAEFDQLYFFKRRKVFKTRADRGGTSCFYLYEINRQDYCPRLRIRRAVEEDNENVVNILDTHSKRFKELYGEYYISELIGRHPEMKRTLFVADMLGEALGIMGLNEEVSIEMLQTTYELGPYHGLVKPTILENETRKQNNKLLSTFGNPIMSGAFGPFDKIADVDRSDQIEDEERHKLQREKCTILIYLNYVKWDSYTALMLQLVQRWFSEEPHVTDKTTTVKTTYKRTIQIIQMPSVSDVLSFEQSKTKHTNSSLELNLYEFTHNNVRISETIDERQFSTAPSSLSEATYLSVVDLLENDDEDQDNYEIVNIEPHLIAVPEMFTSDFITNNPFLSERRLTMPRLKRRVQLKIKTKGYAECIMKGEPNAFALEILAFKDIVDTRNAYDFLEAAFEYMGSYEYCIMCVPASEKSIPLLQHFTYVPVKPKLNVDFALYIAHRNSVRGNIHVRKAEIADIPQIAMFLQDLEAKQTVWTMEQSISKRMPYSAYVMINGCSVIGLAILERLEHKDIHRHKFNIDSYHNSTYHDIDGLRLLKTALMFPVFEPHSRFFVRELLRHSGGSGLVWLTSHRNKLVVTQANALVSAMVPLLPRKSALDIEWKLVEPWKNNSTAYSAWFLSSKLTSVPKVNIDTRLIIVGASRTALAFLNTLLFGDSSTYLTFTNVTLVSPHGLPYFRTQCPEAEMMLLRTRSMMRHTLKSTPYTYYVNSVTGVMSDINTRDKYIVLENGNRYFYDKLFLLFGKQYQHPAYSKALTKTAQKIRANEPLEYVPIDKPGFFNTEPHLFEFSTPENVFIINDLLDATKAISYIKNMSWGRVATENFKIIVYGASIHAYCCLSSLLEIVKGENIFFVEPFPPEDSSMPRVSVFCNQYVDQTVQEMIEKKNITYYRAYYFQSWTCVNNMAISQVEFMSHFKRITLDCSALFYYGKRGIDPNAFVACCKSGIPYNGGILIDPQFRTTISSIYAAGPITRYKCIYYAETCRHKYYESNEVGRILGEQIKSQLDPLVPAYRKKKHVSFDATTDSKSEKNNDEKSNLECDPKPVWELPHLVKPISWHCRLPGGLQYLEVRRPGMKIPHQYVQSLEYNGYVLETCASDGYFKLHLNQKLEVDGITCLTPNLNIQLAKFKLLFGLPSSMLNNVYLRFYTHMIDDFYGFFQEQWAAFLYLDDRDEIMAMVKEVLPKDDPFGPTLREAFIKKSVDCDFAGMKYPKMNPLDETKLDRTQYFESILDYVQLWLSENEVLLPNSYSPIAKPQASGTTNDDYLYKKRKSSVTEMLFYSQ